VWGGALTAVNLDATTAVQLACEGHQEPGGGEG
jgi:hypothetical protein